MAKKQYKLEADGCEWVRFSDIESVIQEAQLPPVKESNIEDHASRLNRQASEWTNNHDMTTLQAALINPPPAKGCVEELLKEIETDNEYDTTRRVIAHRREDGDELDPVAWVRRETDGWSRIEKRRDQKRVIRIAVNSITAASESAGVVHWRGAAAVALADRLESAGHCVEIVLFTCVSGLRACNSRGEYSIVEVMIKRADMPLDVNTVAIAIADIGFTRLAIYTCMTNCAPYRVHFGLGRVRELPKQAREGYDIVFDRDVNDRYSAIRAITRYATGFDA